MSNMQRRWVVSAAAILITAGTAAAQGDDAQAKKQVEDVAHKRDSAAAESGSRMVSVPERALFMLSSTPGTYFHKAIEDLEKQPGHVREDIAMAASVFQLEAARADGDVQQQMNRCALSLFELAEKVETRQVLSKDGLEKPFGKALHTLAAFEQQQAQQGLAAKDAERVGWGVRLANYDLVESLVYAKQDPTPTVSRALFNADTLGEQLIHLAKPTTGQLESRSGAGEAIPAADTQTPAGGGVAKRGTEPLGVNQVRQAAGLPQEAQQVVQDLADALQQTSAAQK